MRARRTLAIAAAALLCGAADVLLVLGSDHFNEPEVWAVFGPLVGWSFVGTGLYAAHRRPDSRFGLLMTMVGFAWFLGPLIAADSPALFTAGILLGSLWGPTFGHVLLSFPTGRLATPARRRLVAASYVLIPLSPLPALLVSDSDEVITDCVGGCPRNVLLISRDESLGEIALALGAARDAGLCLAAVVMLIRQWRAAGAPERRSLVPLFASGGAMLALVAAYATTQADPLLWLAFGVFAATPFAFLAGLARADLSGSRGVRGLMAQLADTPQRADLRDALARALGDPMLELAFWMPELERYVECRRVAGRASGRRRPAPNGHGDRASWRARGRDRARPRAGSGDRPRCGRGDRADAGEPAPRCRAARASRRAARLARASGGGGRRGAPASGAQPP